MHTCSESFHVAVSQCLLGDDVRYDATNCRNSYVIGSLAKYLELIPVCPENIIGLGTPRPPIELILTGEEIRVQGVYDKNQDVTKQLQHCAEEFLDQNQGICGYILKSRSPSCGVNTTKLYDVDGQLLHEHATGAFARSVMANQPGIPVIDEDGLELPQRRLEFLTRIYAIGRLQQAMLAQDPVQAILQFHRRYHPLIDIIAIRQTNTLDNLIANHSQHSDQQQFIDNYSTTFKQIVTTKMARKTFSRYLLLQLDGLDVACDHDAIGTMLTDYDGGLIEWLDLLTHMTMAMDKSGQNSKLLIDRLSWLFPLSLLG